MKFSSRFLLLACLCLWATTVMAEASDEDISNEDYDTGEVAGESETNEEDSSENGIGDSGYEVDEVIKASTAWSVRRSSRRPNRRNNAARSNRTQKRRNTLNRSGKSNNKRSRTGNNKNSSGSRNNSTRSRQNI